MFVLAFRSAWRLPFGGMKTIFPSRALLLFCCALLSWFEQAAERALCRVQLVLRPRHEIRPRRSDLIARCLHVGLYQTNTKTLQRLTQTLASTRIMSVCSCRCPQPHPGPTSTNPLPDHLKVGKIGRQTPSLRIVLLNILAHTLETLKAEPAREWVSGQGTAFQFFRGILVAIILKIINYKLYAHARSHCLQ